MRVFLPPDPLAVLSANEEKTLTLPSPASGRGKKHADRAPLAIA
jgi:hypothetical protein